MSLGLPQPTMPDLNMPNRNLGTLPTDSTPNGIGSADAQGRVPDGGYVTFQVSGACDVYVLIYSPSTGTWITNGAAEANYKVTFAGAGLYYFQAPPGAKFYLYVASGTITCWAACDAATAERLI